MVSALMRLVTTATAFTTAPAFASTALATFPAAAVFALLFALLFGCHIAVP